MCNFFSAVSDGKGKVFFFKPEDVVKIMCAGNKEIYDFNSHTSIADYHGYKGAKEDKLNKWEYNPETKKLTKDALNVDDDGSRVLAQLKDFFKNNDVAYLRNLYGRNSGYLNSGNLNSGDRNSGYRNSGDRNSGDRNSGDLNSGNLNSGNLNSGNLNSGDRNSGDRNSGYLNSGNLNSGNLNSGNRNSGDLNSGQYHTGFFCTGEAPFKAFNVDTDLTRGQYLNLLPEWVEYISPTEWVCESDMTNKEKKENPDFYIREGYLKEIEFKTACKKAWKHADKDDKAKTKALPNFDKKVFFEITGIKV